MIIKIDSMFYKFRLLLFYVVLSVCFQNSFSQDYKHEIEIGTSNDLFVWHTNTDRYYTFGVHFNYRLRSDSTNVLRRYIKIAEKTYHGLGFHMKAYTPGYLDGQRDTVERPYAGWSYFEYQNSFSYQNTAWKIILEMGILGPHSYAGNFQNWFHREVSRDLTVDGWDNQIGDIFGLNIKLEYVRNIIKRQWYDLNVIIDNSIGNIFMYSEPALLLRIGQFNTVGESTSLNNGLLNSSASKEFFIEVAAKLKLSLYNATIQGDIFKNDSLFEQNEINNAIFNAHFGLVYSRPKWTLKAKYFYSDGEINSNDNHFYMTFSGALRW
jgi:hypothetical protein